MRMGKVLFSVDSSNPGLAAFMLDATSIDMLYYYITTAATTVDGYTIIHHCSEENETEDPGQGSFLNK